MRFYKDWAAAIKDPKSAFNPKKLKPSAMTAVLYFVFGFGFYTLLEFFKYADPGYYGTAASLTNNLVGFVFVVSLEVIVAALILGSIHLSAKILGGKGKFLQFFYCASLITAPVMAVYSLIKNGVLLSNSAGLEQIHFFSFWLLILYAIYAISVAIKQLYVFKVPKILGAFIGSAVIIIALIFAYLMASDYYTNQIVCRGDCRQFVVDAYQSSPAPACPQDQLQTAEHSSAAFYCISEALRTCKQAKAYSAKPEYSCGYGSYATSPSPDCNQSNAGMYTFGEVKKDCSYHVITADGPMPSDFLGFTYGESYFFWDQTCRMGTNCFTFVS